MSIPFLSLHKLNLDPEWAAKLPSYLARYHLVLPIAAAAEGVTVAMAHPDNPKLLELLAELLGQHIVPVRAKSQEIRYYLDQFYPPNGGQTARFLAHAHPSPRTLAYLETLGQALEIPLQAHPDSLDLLQPETSRLIAVQWREGLATEGLGAYLQHPASLFLYGDALPPPKRVLLVSQGHWPDHQVIQTGMQLAGYFGASVTLLGIAAPMKRQHILGIGSLLDPSNEAGQHFHRCCQQIEVSGLEAYVKVRQGIPEEEIALELWDGLHNLLLIPVETYGRFVGRVVAKIEALAAGRPIPPLLAIKPSW
jgi:hypothetical protein